MKYMDETKTKIIELEKTMETYQEKTIKESSKYNEIIAALEEEKQNLEKLLEEELEQFNKCSVFLQI